MEIKEIKFNSINLKGVAKIFKGKHILIELSNSREEVGYMELYFHGGKKVTLDAIYCADKYRKHGIGTTLLDISDALLKDYTGYTLCGAYYPAQMLDDIAKVKSDKELDKAARSFYSKHGFNIVKYNDYMADPSKYRGIDTDDYDETNRKFGRSVVYRKIEGKDEYRFIEEDNTITEDPTYKYRRVI